MTSVHPHDPTSQPQPTQAQLDLQRAMMVSCREDDEDEEDDDDFDARAVALPIDHPTSSTSTRTTMVSAFRGGGKRETAFKQKSVKLSDNVEEAGGSSGAAGVNPHQHDHEVALRISSKLHDTLEKIFAQVSKDILKEIRNEGKPQKQLFRETTMRCMAKLQARKGTEMSRSRTRRNMTTLKSATSLLGQHQKKRKNNIFSVVGREENTPSHLDASSPILRKSSIKKIPDQDLASTTEKDVEDLEELTFVAGLEGSTEKEKLTISDDDVDKKGRVKRGTDALTLPSKTRLLRNDPSNTGRTLKDKLEASQKSPPSDPDATIIILTRPPFLLVSHDSNFKGYWESFITLCVLYQAIQAPYELAFQQYFIFNGNFVDTLMIIVFLLDFIHNFVSTFDDDDGDLVIDWQLICQRYASSVWFWIDLVSCIPYELIGGSGASGRSPGSSKTSGFKTLKLLRLFRMGKLLKKADTVSKAGAMRLVRLMVMVVTFFHWTSCGWWFAGKLWFCRRYGYTVSYMVSSLNSTTLVELFGVAGAEDLLDQDSVEAQYNSGFIMEQQICEAFVDEMIGRGANNADAVGTYGLDMQRYDTLTPYTACLSQAASALMGGGNSYTVSENFYFTFVTLLGAVLSATVFGSVAVLLASFDEDEVQYQRKMMGINNRMRYLGIAPHLQDRVRVFYENLWSTNLSCEVNPDQFIDELTKPLGGDIKMWLFEDMLSRVTFLQGVNEIVVEELVKHLATMLFLEGDLVIRRGEIGNWMAFIGKGQVAVLSPADDSIIRTMVSGEYIGEMCLLYSSTRTVDVKAISWVVLHTLSKHDMDEVKVSYPIEIEYIEEFLEDLMVQKQYKHVGKGEASTKEGSSENGDNNDSSVDNLNDEEGIGGVDNARGSGNRSPVKLIKRRSNETQVEVAIHKNSYRSIQNVQAKIKKGASADVVVDEDSNNISEGGKDEGEGADQKEDS